MKVYFITKRLFDVVLALILIILALPLTLLIIITLKINGVHKIFYLQERLGKNYKRFKIIKFTTMKENSLAQGSITVANDPRILPFGKFLRDTKINELPQLVNILLGDMSFVGPRPLHVEGFELYPKSVQPVIYEDVIPGLTGMGSLFFHNEEVILEKNGKDRYCFYKDAIMPLKGALEIWYKEHFGFLLDQKIILLTLISVIVPQSKIFLNSFRGLSHNIIEEFCKISL